MYFKDIFSIETKRFAETIKLTKKLTIEEIIDSPLFNVNFIESIIEIIPLFNFDTISSSNQYDKVLDNKLIICEYKPETVITCS